MANRFFITGPITTDRVTIAGDEAHHLAHVMRARAGDEVTLFDGSGAEFTARIDRVGKHQVELAVLSRQEIDRELPFRLTLGVAMPKGDRQRWLVEKVVELGVTRLVPLRTARGVAQPVPNALERLRRAVIEASKQCGRNRLMQVAEPGDWADFLAAAPSESLRLVAHPGGAHRPACPSCQSPASEVYLAIGPEGGFSDEEIAVAQAAGWETADLGPRILRIETAAILMVARLLSR
ncbi:MAG: 16S rRNA (uracil(1498)-N(3))-methyltransferase [Pirellulales bacterium]